MLQAGLGRMSLWLRRCWCLDGFLLVAKSFASGVHLIQKLELPHKNPPSRRVFMTVLVNRCLGDQPSEWLAFHSIAARTLRSTEGCV